MKYQSIRPWFGRSLLGLAVLSGCSQFGTRHESAGTPMVRTAPYQPAAAPAGQEVVPASYETAATGLAPVTSPYAGVPYYPASVQAASMPVETLQADGSTASGDAQVTQTGYSEPQYLQPAAAATMPASEPSVTLAAPADPQAGFPRGEEEPRRRSFVDVTAAPCFGHAADYSWLSGQVEYSRLSMGWRLRYASVDEEDRYGGSVTLIENRDLDRLKDGQYVMVRGHLSNARATSPPYRVESFNLIDNPNAEPAPANAK